MQNLGELREGLLLGVGNPLLDVSAQVGESILKKYKMKANDAILAEDLHTPLTEELIHSFNAEFLAGGSVQNTARVIQWLVKKPHVVTYFGAVGHDSYSEILKERALSCGVNVQYQYINNVPTGTCAVLITGHDRSLCANLSAANYFTIDHLHKNKIYIQMAEFYYVSGFFLTVCPPAIVEIAKHAEQNNLAFVMNLSAPYLSQYYKAPMMKVMPYVDVLFGNDEEYRTFAKEQHLGVEDLKEIAIRVCKLPKRNMQRNRVAILTQGPGPIIVAEDDKISEIIVPFLPAEKIVDTNGAGDAFTGGFLAQYIQGKPLKFCIQCGIYAALVIIQHPGCTFDGSEPFKSEKDLLLVTQVSPQARPTPTESPIEVTRRSQTSKAKDSTPKPARTPKRGGFPRVIT